MFSYSPQEEEKLKKRNLSFEQIIQDYDERDLEYALEASIPELEFVHGCVPEEGSDEVYESWSVTALSSTKPMQQANASTSTHPTPEESQKFQERDQSVRDQGHKELTYVLEPDLSKLDDFSQDRHNAFSLFAKPHIPKEQAGEKKAKSSDTSKQEQAATIHGKSKDIS